MTTVNPGAEVAQRSAPTKEELEAVAQHHKELKDRLFEIESKFDGAALLVAGGAFTVSAAFVPRLDIGLKLPWWLMIAWIAWALCLLLSAGGHLLSARCHKRRIRMIDQQVYDEARWQDDFWDFLIGPVNWTMLGSLVVGFIAFGIFTFANLNFGGANGQSEEERKKETVEETIQRLCAGACEQCPEPACRVSQGEEGQGSAVMNQQPKNPNQKQPQRLPLERKERGAPAPNDGNRANSVPSTPPNFPRDPKPAHKEKADQ